MKDNQFILAGDIGGTKTTLAIFHPEAGPHRPVDKTTFPSRSYPSLQALIEEFLKGKQYQFGKAVFGVAGPVVDGQARVTNLSWTPDIQTLREALGVPVSLLNDLEAIAHALPFLESKDLETLNPGRPVQHAPLAVIAPGTGLGEAFLLWSGTSYVPYPSEGGHADFAPTTTTELELLAYLLPRFGHVSYEQVCSGRGLPNLYAFLKDSGLFQEPGWLHEELDLADDPTSVIVQSALEGKAEICTAALEQFVSILGSEAGNLALKVLATGGVYLGGGIPPRILPFLRSSTFIQSFNRKGRFSGLLSNIPVHVICNPEVALIGAACHGLETVQHDV